MASGRNGRGSLLGVIAYVAVPGERRRQAAVHFRRAGFEALRGVAALARMDGTGARPAEAPRERIEIR